MVEGVKEDGEEARSDEGDHQRQIFKWRRIERVNRGKGGINRELAGCCFEDRYSDEEHFKVRRV